MNSVSMGSLGDVVPFALVSTGSVALCLLRRFF
jgi:hypothetical protein